MNVSPDRRDTETSFHLFVDESGGRRRLRALWRLLLQYLLYKVSLPLILNVLVVGWLAILSGGESLYSNKVALSLIADSPALPLITGTATLAAVLLSVWFAGRFLDQRPFADFGFHPGRGWWLDLLFGIFLGALLMSAIFLVELALGWVRVTGSLESHASGASFAYGILFPVEFFLCVGLYEETLFRGYQIRNAAEGLNHPAIGSRDAVLLAWILSSALFGLLHAGNPNTTLLSTFNISLAGLMLGLGYILTGELAIPIGLHIAWNFFEGNVYGFPVSGLNPIGATFLTTKLGGSALFTGGVFGPEGGLLEPAAVLLGCLLIALWVRFRYGRVAIKVDLAERPKQSLPASKDQ